MKTITEIAITIGFITLWLFCVTLGLFAIGGIWGAIAAGVYNAFRWLT